MLDQFEQCLIRKILEEFYPNKLLYRLDVLYLQPLPRMHSLFYRFVKIFN